VARFVNFGEGVLIKVSRFSYYMRKGYYKVFPVLLYRRGVCIQKGSGLIILWGEGYFNKVTGFENFVEEGVFTTGVPEFVCYLGEREVIQTRFSGFCVIFFGERGLLNTGFRA